MRNLYSFLLVGLFTLGGTAAQAADLKAGQALHEAHCLSCHDSGVYTRDDRKVNSLAGLRKQVQRCELSLGLTWHDDDVENVVQHLNGTYYKVQ
jgi:hypothetical protein